jgi:hypothetical protein
MTTTWDIAACVESLMSAEQAVCSIIVYVNTYSHTSPEHHVTLAANNGSTQ